MPRFGWKDVKSGPAVYLGVIEEEIELDPGEERGAVVDLFHRVFHRARDCKTLKERGQCKSTTNCMITRSKF